MNREQMWEFLEDVIGVASDTLRVVTNINGFSEETMEDILYAVAGYHSFDQLEEEV